MLTQKSLRDKDYQFATLIATGRYTGLRISDLRTLRWQDMTNPLVLTEKKTGKGRTIHLHDDLLQFLDQVKAEIKPKPNALMFT